MTDTDTTVDATYTNPTNVCPRCRSSFWVAEHPSGRTIESLRPGVVYRFMCRECGQMWEDAVTWTIVRVEVTR